MVGKGDVGGAVAPVVKFRGKGWVLDLANFKILIILLVLNINADMLLWCFNC
jgi:hypothetical protein